jgi:amino acid adenylation domain-containing protein
MTNRLYTLSLAQREIYYEQMMFPALPIYNIGARIDIHGNIYPKFFDQAYQALIASHTMLHVAFSSEGNSPSFRVLEEYNYHVRFVDFSASRDGLNEAIQFMDKEFSITIDITTGEPLHVFYLLKISPVQNIFFCKLQHLITDGWGASLLFARLTQAYNELLHNKPVQLSNDNLYTQFIDDDISYLQSERYVHDKEYWSKRIHSFTRSFIPKINWSQDTQLKSAREEIYLDIADVDKLRLLASGFRVSLFHVFLGLFYVQLGRLFNKNDFTIGLPVLNRDNAAYKRAVGAFSGIMPLQVSIAPGDTFSDILVRIRAQLREDFRHQRFPLSHIRALDADSFAGQLFDVFFSYEKHNYAFSFDELQCEVIPMSNNAERVPLAIYLREFDETKDIKIDFDYNLNYFTQQSVRALVNCFKYLVKQVLDEPRILVKDVRYAAIDVANSTNDRHHFESIPSLFNEQVKKAPYNIAITFAGSEISYKELDERSDRVAYYLRDHYSVETDDVVALLCKRSDFMIVAILGIMKSGAAYLPIDHQYPKDRIAFILENSKAKVVIYDDESIFENVSTPLHSEIKPSDLAYVIYTSGSTGQPKGVMIEHAQLSYFLQQARKIFEITGNDGILATTTFSFDISVLELLLPLICGAKVILMPDGAFRDTNELIRQIELNKPTVIQATPGWFEILLQGGWPGSPDLKTICGGELLTTALADKLLKATGQLINMYGPTETTIWSTVKWIKSADDISIGVAIQGTTTYIIDDNNMILPNGFVGEICIGGAGVGRGYLFNPKLTDEKFILHPDGHQRIYKTGDLGKILPNGEIEFIGRRDDQVKIRGYRIELGEIRTQLLNCAHIDEAVVLCIEDKGQKVLIGYVTSKLLVQESNIKQQLRESLPDFMIPSVIMPLDKMPLMTGGKINKSALPKPVDLETRSATRIAPHNETQKRLVDIWEQVLNRTGISIRDDFFELGGHSLRAMQVISGIHSEFGVKVQFIDIFNNSTIEELAELIGTKTHGDVPCIPIVPRQRYYKTSNSQKRLWILGQSKESNFAYNLVNAYRLEGNLDGDVLEKCIRALIDRHESLRTSFVVVDGEPMQAIASPAETGFLLQRRNIADDAEIDRLLNLEALTPFDLGTAPLLRAVLVQRSPGIHFLVFSIHHIVSDHWSFEILLRELRQLYRDYHGEHSNMLPPLRIQYKDFAAWQDNLLADGNLLSQKNFWLKHLGGELPVLSLPLDFSRPAIKTYRGATIKATFDPKLTEYFKSMPKYHRVSMFTGLLAGVNLLLGRYNASNDIIVGSPAADRPLRELEDQVGFYVNVVPLRTIFSTTDTFAGLLANTKQTVIESFDNKLYPFDQLIDDLHANTDLSHSPVFDVLVSYSEMDGVLKNDLLGNGSTGTFLETGSPVARYDLTFFFQSIGETVVLEINYNSDLFKRETVAKMLMHYTSLMSSVMRSPVDCQLKDLDWISAQEKKLVLSKGKGRTMQYPAEATLQSLFEDRVAKDPEAVALRYGDKSLTYKKLNYDGNQLASYLKIEYNLRSDDAVGILTSRSELMIVAMLAVLKAGAAYLPIDETLPPARVRQLVSDSGVKLLVTDQTDEIEFEPTVPVVSLKDIGEKLTALSGKNFPSQSTSHNLAYIIYTSGSTGIPKGVMIEHLSIVNFLCYVQSELQIDPSDHILAITSFSFDISVLEIFLPLISGASIELMDRGAIVDVSVLKNEIVQKDPTVIQATPGMWQALIDAGWSGGDDVLIITGGEALSQTLGANLLQRCRHVRNMYGPTETTIWSTALLLSVNEKVSIGKPIANTVVYIVDENNRVMPDGIAGEICIGGDGVARGYRNKEKLTNEKFIVDPYNSSKRIYKTGDIGRFTEDGNIEFMGRRDEQIKLRGHRIELGEIRSQLLSFNDISNAVVMMEGTPTDRFLVAYVTAKAETTSAQIKMHLRSKLPEYMIPSYVVLVDSIPLNINGKVDKSALPDLRSLIAHDRDVISHPRNDMERKLVAIWEEVLGHKGVDIMDDFFEIGGHSLKAVQVMSRIHRELNIKIELREIFSNRTISTLSEALTNLEIEKYEEIALAPIQPHYELSYAQKQLWIQSRFAEGNIAFNLPGTYQIAGPLDIDQFTKAFQLLIDRHESLRTSFVMIDGEVRQMISGAPGAKFPFEDINLELSDDPENSAREIAVKDGLQPFDLRKGPLLRSKLLRLPGDRHLFVFTMHHIISDGWSAELLLRELSAVYYSLVRGLPYPLTALKIQYKDYAAWHSGKSKSGEFDTDKSYWVNELRGDRLVSLPSDFLRPAVPSFAGDSVLTTMDRSTIDALRKISRSLNASLYDIMVSAAKVLMYRYTKDPTSVIGCPVANRGHIDLESQVGCYVTALPVKTTIKEYETFESLVLQVKQKISAGNRHVYPIDEILDELDLDVKSRAALFDFVVVLHTPSIYDNMLFKPYNHFNGVFKMVKADLRLEMIDEGNDILINFEYNTRLFRNASIVGMKDKFLEILSVVSNSPSIKINDLKFSSAVTREDMEDSFNVNF